MFCSQHIDKLMATADDKGRCIIFEADEGLKEVAWQKFQF